MFRYLALATFADIFGVATAETGPSVRRFEGTVSIPQPFQEGRLTWPPTPPDNHTVKELGTFGQLQLCEDACKRFVNVDVSPVSGWTRCQSYTYFPSTGRCVAVVSDEWQPRQDDGATSGRLTWPAAACFVDADCSYNGRCDRASYCSCDEAWEGDRCQTLALRPTRRHWGLRQVDAGANTSSWGGSVLLDPETGIYHMWAAEMVQHCGIDAWATNSRVVRATSATAEGPYERVQEVWPVFAHEPNVMRAPTGEWVMFFTALPPDSPTPTQCAQCTSGSTPASCPGGPGFDAPSYMSWALAPEGPWSEPALLFEGQASNFDTNLAGVIQEDGSVIGIVRTVGPVMTQDGERESVTHLMTASDWRDSSTYVGRWDERLFPNRTILDFMGVEDPHVYFDSRGVLHAVFHSQLEADDQRLCGGHAYSVDGETWTFTGTAWNNTVTYEDAAGELAQFSFSRRERPHVIFGDPASPFRITHLSTGVQFGEASPVSLPEQDACYTLVQPVRGDAEPTQVLQI